MLSLLKPTPAAIEAFLRAQGRLALTYSEVGATAEHPPAGYIVDHTRVRLGVGTDVFEAAKSSLERWEQFHLGWAEVWPIDAPIEPGKVVAVLARAVGLWWLNACRIVYVVDEAQPVRRFGFGYGTLPSHAGSGEERFAIEHDLEDDSVWYDILAFSRPRHFFARLGYPLVRRLQRRFGRDSAAAMLRNVRKVVGR
jgi:uncharacterized protein (UPF0548 family)